MSHESLRRADELLSELVEMVETARTVPMSASCVVPRERVLDILDELRETLPVEIDEARRVLGTRDELLHDAHVQAKQAREQAVGEAETLRADAEHAVAALRQEAEAQAQEILDTAGAEHTRLVSATGVHQAAARAAAELHDAAESYDTSVREQADAHAEAVREQAEQYDDETRAAADQYAARLARDAEDYAERTLAELAATLQRAANTAEQGRQALDRRREDDAPVPGDDSVSELEQTPISA
jgi:vacuolar-type H+-ATPase subunit H